jgi:hypothetical protein
MLFRKYRDDLGRTIYEGARALHKMGVLNDEEMRDFENDCLEPRKNPFAALFHSPAVSAPPAVGAPA